jgi:hypothetical protein
MRRHVRRSRLEEKGLPRVPLSRPPHRKILDAEGVEEIAYMVIVRVVTRSMIGPSAHGVD